MFCCCCCFNFNEKKLCDCCSYFTQKIFQIFYIISKIFLLIFLIITMCIINWGKFPGINLTLFIIILLIILCCLILGILIYYFTQRTPIEETMKKSINTIAIIGFIISIICLVLCVIEEILLSLSFSKAHEIYPCDKTNDSKMQGSIGFFFYKRNDINSDKLSSDYANNDKRLLASSNDCYNIFLTTAVYGMAYFTFTMIELICFIGCCFWSQSKKEYSPKITEYNNYNQGNYAQYPNNQIADVNILGVHIQRPQLVIINQGKNMQYSDPAQNNYNENYINTFNFQNQNYENYGNMQQNINRNDSVNYPPEPVEKRKTNQNIFPNSSDRNNYS